jgi:hypothetical protein
MQLHFIFGNSLYSLEASSDITIKDLKALLEIETEIPPQFQEIRYNGQLLGQEEKALRDYSIIEESCMLSITKLPSLDSNNPHISQTKSTTAINPTPASNTQNIHSLGFDVDEQIQIEEAIQQANIAANLQAAIEHHPEAFGSVVMLYVCLTVNSHPLKAFVDCGAQATIMSLKCAEQCNLSRLIDKRFSGVARGVGERKIVGRVHAAEIVIGGLHLACSFNIIEDGDSGIDLLFGLDMLRRHQACIDLTKNALVIHGVSIPFLPESEIPKLINQP